MTRIMVGVVAVLVTSCAGERPTFGPDLSTTSSANAVEPGSSSEDSNGEQATGEQTNGNLTIHGSGSDATGVAVSPSSTDSPNATAPNGSTTGAAAVTPTSEGTSEAKPKGAACTTTDDCESGYCVDEVCCESACSKVCERCDAPDEPGSCVAAESDSACGELSCFEDTDCRKYSAPANAPNCASRGECVDEPECDVENVDADTECGSGENAGSCDGEGECIVPNKAALGDECGSDGECGSDHCVPQANGELVCCDGACDGLCQACGEDGHCDAAALDDDDCDAIECEQDSSCTDYPEALTNNRCSAFGQCVTEATYCSPTHAPETTSCGSGMNCDGAGQCVVTCPTNSGPSRVCSSDCPCTTAQGTCTSNDDCVSGLVCTADAEAKLGFDGSSCMPSHCTNNTQDASETSVDCGGECGCRATFQIISYTGLPSGANFSQLYGMSADGSTLIGNIARGRSSFPAVVNATTGAVTELPNHGAGGSGYDLSADGSIAIGTLACADLPTCSDSTARPYRWTNEGEPTALMQNGSARAISTSGNVIVGDYYTGSANAVFRYSNGAAGTLSTLAYARAVSGNGQFIIGSLASDTNKYGVWSVQQNALVSITPPSDWTSWQAKAINDTGTAFIGYGYKSSSSTYYPFVWTNGSFEVIDIPANTQTITNDLSADGTVVVGQSGTVALTEAFIWDTNDGMRRILDELASRGLELATDLTLRQVEFVSADGHILVGSYGVGTEVSAFRVTLQD